MQEPHIMHWEGALWVFNFIKNDLGKGLIYQCHNHLHIEAYFYDRYDEDKGNLKSTTEYYNFYLRLYLGFNVK